MKNHKIILPSIAAMTIFVVWSLSPRLVDPSSTIIQKAMAENATTNTTIPTNTNITLGVQSTSFTFTQYGFCKLKCALYSMLFSF